MATLNNQIGTMMYQQCIMYPSDFCSRQANGRTLVHLGAGWKQTAVVDPEEQLDSHPLLLCSCLVKLQQWF